MKKVLGKQPSPKLSCTIYSKESLNHRHIKINFYFIIQFNFFFFMESKTKIFKQIFLILLIDRNI